MQKIQDKNAKADRLIQDIQKKSEKRINKK